MRSMSCRCCASLLLLLSFFSPSLLFADDEPPIREMLRFVDEDTMRSAHRLLASREQPVRFDLAALNERRLRLPLPEGQTVLVDRVDVEARRPGDFVWRGKIANLSGDAAGDVTLTVRDGKVLGRIVVPGAAYRIVPAEGGGHRMEAIEEMVLDEPFESLELEAQPELREIVRQESLREPVREETAGSGPFRAGTPPISRHKVIIFYTSRAREAAGGHDTIRQQIQHEVDLANTAFANSRIQVRLELPYVAEATHAEGSGSSLQWVRFDHEVNQLQRRYGAAFAAVVVEEMQGCGVAASILSRDQLLDRGVAARGAVQLRRSCLNQSWVLLAHEIGHTLGCEHDPAWGSNPKTALFPYAYGHFVDGSFRTVMSYPNECQNGCPAIQYFSSPSLTFNGQPTGIAGQRDNQRVINATRTRFAPPPAADQPCKGSATILCLGDRRFNVQVDWFSQYDRSGGVARALPRTGSTGFFSFSDPSNVELMVKVLDFGNTVKVFYGQLTDLEFQLLVHDRRTGRTRTYYNTANECGGIDQNAFPGGNTLAANRAASRDAAPFAACRPGPNTLCLGKNRFQVEVDWRNPGNGQAGQAGATPLSQLTGAFYFTDKNSLELMTKIIDQGDRVDVFYGTLTDLEYTITVTDTSTGAVKTYRNPAGRYCGGLEVDAF